MAKCVHTSIKIALLSNYECEIVGVGKFSVSEASVMRCAKCEERKRVRKFLKSQFYVLMSAIAIIMKAKL